jgi:hypothetical protein
MIVSKDVIDTIMYAQKEITKLLEENSEHQAEIIRLNEVIKQQDAAYACI